MNKARQADNIDPNLLGAKQKPKFKWFACCSGRGKNKNKGKEPEIKIGESMVSNSLRKEETTQMSSINTSAIQENGINTTADKSKKKPIVPKLNIEGVEIIDTI